MGNMPAFLPQLTSSLSYTQNSAAGEPQLRHCYEIASWGYLRKVLN